MAAKLERIGRYAVAAPLGRDDVSEAYLARADGAGSWVTVRIGSEAVREDPGFGERLVAEAKRLVAQRHENVVPIHDAGEEGGLAFVVSEYVPGEKLSELMRLGKESGAELPKAVALRIVVDALRGLAAVHEHDGAIVHGQLGPQSILVGADGVARLVDLAFARAMRRSPDAPADVATDVWAAGVLAWEIVTGRRLTSKGEEDPPLLSNAITDAGAISGDLEQAVAAALRIDRGERLKTVSELVTRLADAARGAGMLAEIEDVAKEVERLAGAEIAKRKEILDAPASAPADKQTVIGIAAPPAPLDPPDKPVPEALGSVLALNVDLGAHVGERASDAVLGELSAPPPPSEEEPEVYRSPVVPPGGPLRRAFDAVRVTFSPPWTKEKKIIVSATGGVLVLLLVVLVAVASTGEPEASSATTTSSASAVTVASAVPAPPPAPAPAPSQRKLRITADGAIAKVAIGDRVVEAGGSSTTEIDLTDAERVRPVRVVVTGVDGRVASVTADPATRGLDVALEEDLIELAPPLPPPAAPTAAVRPPQRVVAAPAPPKEKRTWPKRTPKK